MTDTPLTRYRATMAALLDSHPEPIDLSTIETRWREDVAAWAAGDLDVHPQRPPVRLGVTICTLKRRHGDGDMEQLGTPKGGLVWANRDYLSDTAVTIERWDVIDTHGGKLSRWLIDEDDILDWNDGILVYTGEQHWRHIENIHARVKAAAGRKNAEPWLERAQFALFGLLERHNNGGETS